MAEQAGRGRIRPVDRVRPELAVVRHRHLLVSATLVMMGCGDEGRPTGDESFAADPVAGEGLTATLPGGVTMDFVWIEPGMFTMGSPESEVGRWEDEGPQHEVTISSGFWMGRYEVTQAQWEAVMETAPWAGVDLVRAHPEHPATCVSWNDVQDFVRRLNEAEGRQVYGLPTEAQWEHACRAGTSTRWSFGDDEGQLRKHAWYSENAWDVGIQDAQPVGTKLPNPWGLFDMHGNAYEWVEDRYGPYSSGRLEDPQGPSTGSLRVFRGGDVGSGARYTRSAFRYFHWQDRRVYFGARLLRRG